MSTIDPFQLFAAATEDQLIDAQWALLEHFAWEKKIQGPGLDELRAKDPDHKHEHLPLLLFGNNAQRQTLETVRQAICDQYKTSSFEEALAHHARSLMPQDTDFASLDKRVIQNAAATLGKKPNDVFQQDPEDLESEDYTLQSGDLVKIYLSNEIEQDGKWVETDNWVVEVSGVVPGGSGTVGQKLEAVFAPGAPENEAKLKELVNKALAL